MTSNSFGLSRTIPRPITVPISPTHEHLYPSQNYSQQYPTAMTPSNHLSYRDQTLSPRIDLQHSPASVSSYNTPSHIDYSSSSPNMPSADSLDPIYSVKGSLCVYQFDPKEGEANMPLTVRLDYRNPYDPERLARLRIIFGEIPLQTTTIPLLHPEEPSTGTGDIQLHAIIPQQQQYDTPYVKLSVQVVKEHVVIDAVEFGYFTFWESGQLALVSYHF